METSLLTEIGGVDERLIRVEDKLTKVDGRLDKVEGRLAKVEENTGRILEIVTSIDKQNKELKDLPAKVLQHGEEIHKLKMKS